MCYKDTLEEEVAFVTSLAKSPQIQRHGVDDRQQGILTKRSHGAMAANEGTFHPYCCCRPPQSWINLISYRCLAKGIADRRTSG
jgi:hypothetical protein